MADEAGSERRRQGQQRQQQYRDINAQQEIEGGARSSRTGRAARVSVLAENRPLG